MNHEWMERCQKAEHERDEAEAKVAALREELQRATAKHDALAGKVVALRIALQLIENANNALSGARTQEMYLAMIDSGHEELLEDLEAARRLSRRTVADTAQVVSDYEARIRAEALADFLGRQIEFSARTFGPGLRTAGVVDHIRKELGEIEEDPSDLVEWIDVIILAFDGFWRHGGKPEQLMEMLEAKFAKNRSRKWGPIVDGKAIEHIREEGE